MSDAMLFKFQAPVGQISLYESGVIAGADCRKREGKPSIFQLVACDEHSAGFRDGYFQREKRNSPVSRRSGYAPGCDAQL